MADSPHSTSIDDSGGALRMVADKLGNLPERLADILRGVDDHSPAAQSSRRQQASAQGQQGGQAGGGAPAGPDRWDATANLLGAASPFAPQLGQLGTLMHQVRHLAEAWEQFHAAWSPAAMRGEGGTPAGPEQPTYGMQPQGWQAPEVPHPEAPSERLRETVGMQAEGWQPPEPPVPLTPPAARDTYPLAPEVPAPPEAPPDRLRDTVGVLPPEWGAPEVPAPVSPSERLRETYPTAPEMPPMVGPVTPVEQQRETRGMQPQGWQAPEVPAPVSPSERLRETYGTAPEVPAPEPPVSPAEQRDTVGMKPEGWEPPEVPRVVPLGSRETYGVEGEGRTGAQRTRESAHAPEAPVVPAFHAPGEAGPADGLGGLADLLGAAPGDAGAGPAGSTDDPEQTREVLVGLKTAVEDLTRVMQTGEGTGGEPASKTTSAAGTGKAVVQEVTRRAAGGRRGAHVIDDFSHLLGGVLRVGKALE